MMPPGHIALTWAMAQLWPQTELDYRTLALSAMVPDAVDKPLAIWVFKDAKSTQLAGHAFLPHAFLLILTVFIWPKGLPYVLAVNGHLVVDRIWRHCPTFWWPFYGWRTFREYKPMNTPKTMFKAYLEIIRLPQVWLPELVALVFLLWFVWRYRLYRSHNLRRFLQYGHING